MFQQIVDWLWPPSLITLAFLFIYMIFNLDKAENLASKITRIFSYFSMKAERHTIATDIQSKIRVCRKDNIIGEILKHGIKFKWVTDEQNSSYMDGDDVVVIMNHHSNNAQNFLNAILQYTELAVLPDVRNEIPPKIMLPITLVVQDKIIREQRPEAVPMFRDGVMHNAIVKEPPLEPTIEKLKQLDKAGWFVPIYLNEIQHIGSRLYELNDEQKNNTLNKFLEFLMTIVVRPPKSNVPLSFKNKIFGLNIILVAIPKNIASEDIDVYIDRVKHATIHEFDSIYVTGRGVNTDFTRKVIDAIKAKNIAKHIWTKKHEYKDKRGITALLALFRNPFVQKD